MQEKRGRMLFQSEQERYCHWKDAFALSHATFIDCCQIADREVIEGRLEQKRRRVQIVQQIAGMMQLKTRTHRVADCHCGRGCVARFSLNLRISVLIGRNYAALLRQEIAARNSSYAALNQLPHVTSYGDLPVVVYQQSESGQHHGNFMSASYRAILKRPEWRRRLAKVHSQGKHSLSKWERI